MTTDDIAARHAVGKQRTVELRQCSLFVDSEPLAKAMSDAADWIDGAIADISQLTAALADAEARGRLAGLEEAASVAEDNSDYGTSGNMIVGYIRALAKSSEDGKQEI